MGLIVDTGMAISSERRRESPEQLVRNILAAMGPVDLAISAVSVVEFTHGIYRAQSADQAIRRKNYAEGLFRRIPIEPLTFEIAQLAGRIEGEQAALGLMLDFEDLVIGSTALHLGFDVLTLNLKHFKMIPGLTVHTL